MARARAPECWVNPLIALQGPFGAARSYLRTMPSHLSIMQSPQNCAVRLPRVVTLELSAFRESGKIGRRRGADELALVGGGSDTHALPRRAVEACYCGECRGLRGSKSR